MKTIRDLHGRWKRIAHDPRHPWVLIDADLCEPAIRCASRHECREHQRAAGGQIVRTHGERRRTSS